MKRACPPHQSWVTDKRVKEGGYCRKLQGRKHPLTSPAAKMRQVAPVLPQEAPSDYRGQLLSVGITSAVLGALGGSVAAAMLLTPKGSDEAFRSGQKDAAHKYEVQAAELISKHQEAIEKLKEEYEKKGVTPSDTPAPVDTKLKEENDRLTQELGTLQEKHERVSNALKAIEKERDGLATAHAKATSDLEAATTKLTQLQKKPQDNPDLIRAKDELARQVRDLSQRSSDLQTALDETKQAHATLSAAHEQTKTELKAANEAVEAQGKQLERDRQMLGHERKKLSVVGQRAAEKLKGQATTIARLNQHVAQLEVDMQVTGKELAAAEEKVMKAKEEHSKTTEQLGATQQQLAMAQQQLEQAKLDLENHEKSATKAIDKSNESHRRRNKELSEKVAEHQQTIAEHENTIATLKAQVQAFGTPSAELAVLRQKHAALEAQHKQATESLTALTNEHNQAKKTLEEANIQAIELHDRMATENERLQSELNAAKGEINSTTAGTLIERIQQLEAANEAYRKELYPVDSSANIATHLHGSASRESRGGIQLGLTLQRGKSSFDQDPSKFADEIAIATNNLFAPLEEQAVLTGVPAFGGKKSRPGLLQDWENYNKKVFSRTKSQFKTTEDVDAFWQDLAIAHHQHIRRRAVFREDLEKLRDTYDRSSRDLALEFHGKFSVAQSDTEKKRLISDYGSRFQEQYKQMKTSVYDLQRSIMDNPLFSLAPHRAEDGTLDPKARDVILEINKPYKYISALLGGKKGRR